jgi:hypothetical protein
MTEEERALKQEALIEDFMKDVNLLFPFMRKKKKNRLKSLVTLSIMSGAIISLDYVISKFDNLNNDNKVRVTENPL